uniref:tRNAHis guanylyltransferase catalytic domain-containing protein n=1 Tax=Calcidiscus leptoporus TaxID=127549 RepID=A0A7S0ISQ3_9EUKA
MQASALDILGRLKRYNPVVVEGMDPRLHYLAPHIPKVDWTALGDIVAAREKSTTGQVDGSQWISLRLDGCGFSKAVRLMHSKGILEPGYSETFAQCMCGALRGLMEHFHAALGYTQSDEMVVFIPPTSIVRGERQAHTRSGRVTKLTTLAASLVTALFLMELSQLCVSKGCGLDGLASILPHFDCRLGSYASWEEARALLLWRAYDCSVNGVSDAVHQIRGSGKQVQSLGRREKIAWLWKQGHLPLPRHQAYGTVLAKVKRAAEGHNPIKGTTVRTLRAVIEHVDGPVLELARREALFPPDDVVSNHDA